MRRVPRISYARSADGVSLAFTVAGDGPALVFIPWVPFSNLRMEWQNPFLNRVFEQLAQRLRLVHYDGRGTGHSQRDVTDLSLEAMVSDLEAVIDRAGLAEVSLLGQYNSCPHVIAYAARHPQRVKRMVLFAGSARGWNAMSAKQTQALLSLIEQDWDLFADTRGAPVDGLVCGGGRACHRRRDPGRGHAAGRARHHAGGQRGRCHRAAAEGGRADPSAPPAGYDPDPGRGCALAGDGFAARAAGAA